MSCFLIASGSVVHQYFHAALLRLKFVCKYLQFSVKEVHFQLGKFINNIYYILSIFTVTPIILYLFYLFFNSYYKHVLPLEKETLF